MKTFNASDGHTWSIDITVGALLRIKTHCGLDLLNNPLDFPTDIEGIVNVLWSVVQPQAQTAGINAEGFGEHLGGEQLCEACSIFVDELQGFFLGLKQEMKAELLKQTWKFVKKQDRTAAKQLRDTLGETSTV